MTTVLDKESVGFAVPKQGPFHVDAQVIVSMGQGVPKSAVAMQLDVDSQGAVVVTLGKGASSKRLSINPDGQCGVMIYDQKFSLFRDEALSAKFKSVIDEARRSGKIYPAQLNPFAVWTVQENEKSHVFDAPLVSNPAEDVPPPAVVEPLVAKPAEPTVVNAKISNAEFAKIAQAIGAKQKMVVRGEAFDGGASYDADAIVKLYHQIDGKKDERSNVLVAMAVMPHMTLEQRDKNFSHLTREDAAGKMRALVKEEVKLAGLAEFLVKIHTGDLASLGFEGIATTMQELAKQCALAPALCPSPKGDARAAPQPAR